MVRNRRWLVIILAVAVVFIAATAGVIALRFQPQQVRDGEDPSIREVAQDFLRSAAKPDLREACLFVIPGGGYLRPCREDLEGRTDLKTLTDLEDGVKVRQVHVDGDTATVTSADLEPRPSWEVTVTVVDDPEAGWRVREVNGVPIRWLGTNLR